jgi:hypothetical protein
MDRMRQLLTGSLDLLLLAAGILALILAPQAGMCSTACDINGTMILDMLGFVLIVIGGTWALATRWPTATMRNPFVRFVATWVIVAVTGSVWAFGMLSDWHFAPYCGSPDSCSGWPDIASSIALFTVIGFVAAVVVTAVNAASPRAGQNQ